MRDREGYHLKKDGTRDKRSKGPNAKHIVNREPNVDDQWPPADGKWHYWHGYECMVPVPRARPEVKD